MKPFLTIGLLLLNIISYSQINKGAIFIGGELSGTHNKVTQDGSFFSSQVGFTFSPVYGQAIRKNLILGGLLIATFEKDDFTSTNTKQEQNSYGVGVFVRKYYPLKTLPIYFFFEGRLSGIYSPFVQKTTLTGNKQNQNFYIIDVEAFPGVSFALNKKFHLETGFNNFFLAEFFHEKKIISSPTTSTVYRTNTITIYNSLNNKATFSLGFRLLINE